MSRSRARVLVALMTLTPTGPAAMAADRSRTDPADAELLEFLGSVDSGADAQGADDGSWIEYLSQTDIDQIVTTDPHRGPGVKQAASASPPSASGDKKDE